MRKRIVVLALVCFAAALSACGFHGADRPPADAAAPPGGVPGWTQEYISLVPPIMMRDPLLEMLEQTDGPIPYTYGEAVKLTGHSCMIVASAWSMTRKALEALYPGGETPVRGRIRIEAPGAEGEWNLGVFGQVMTYVTGAATEGGFSGSAFAKGNAAAVRRNRLIYAAKPLGLPPPEMRWIFTRTDTGRKVAVGWDIRRVRPPLSEASIAGPGEALASGRVSREEAEAFVRDWNAAALFVLRNADTLQGLVTVEPVS